MVIFHCYLSSPEGIPISTLAHNTWALHQKKPTGRALLHRLQAQGDPNDSTDVSKSTHAVFWKHNDQECIIMISVVYPETKFNVS